jgi:hypothetical protein
MNPPSVYDVPSPRSHKTRRMTPTSSRTFPSLRLSVSFKVYSLDEHENDKHDQYHAENCKYSHITFLPFQDVN